jgi:hypothetical protein
MRARVSCRLTASILAAARLSGEPMGKSSGLSVSMLNLFRLVSRNRVSLNVCAKLLLGPRRVRTIHDLHKEPFLADSTRAARQFIIASVHGTDNYRCTSEWLVLRSEQCSGRCSRFGRAERKILGTQSVRRFLRLSTELFHLLETMLAARLRRRRPPVPRDSFCQTPLASWSARSPHFGAASLQRDLPTLAQREYLRRVP